METRAVSRLRSLAEMRKLATAPISVISSAAKQREQRRLLLSLPDGGLQREQDHQAARDRGCGVRQAQP
ncbi:hypothetical protein [Bifidobacterium sp.]|uniref:hypothetical protein n=1 Tax=Bifidobacterium sp. TaxID=41200 RepID=UPI0025C5FA25|nr:hypothetical protein [Bifidobacterium sp.]MCI1224402.1 hypothetical protein [Bifidobacterium sp.]